MTNWHRPHVKATADSERAPDLFTVLAYDDDSKLFYGEDQTLGFAFVCRPLVGLNEAAEQGLPVLLNINWPTDAIVQWSLLGLPDVFDRLDDMMVMRLGQQDRLLREMVAARHDFLLDAVDQPFSQRNRLRLRDVHLVMTVKAPLFGQEPSEEDIETFRQTRLSVEQQLTTIGLAPEAMTAERWQRLMTVILNMHPEASWRRKVPAEVVDDRPLREQVLDFGGDVQVERNALTLGGKMRVAVMSVKRWPRLVQFGHAAAYMGDVWRGVNGIREPFVLTATVHYPDQMKLKSKVANKGMMITRQTFGQMRHFLPILGLKKDDHDEMQDAFDAGDRPVRLNITLCLFAPTEHELVQACSNAETYWGNLMFTMMRDEFFVLPLFVNALPLCSELSVLDETRRFKSMCTRHVLPLLPIFGDWKGTGSPLLTVISRNGQFMGVNPWSSHSNYNSVIAATSGAGKSVFANELIAGVLSCGGIVWVIDVGYSYLKQCKLFGGDFLRFSTDSDLCLNPFPLIKEDDQEDFLEQFDMLTGLIAAMAAPTEKLTDLQMAQVKRTLSEVWAEKGRQTIIDDIAERLLAHEDPRVRDVGTQLYSFTAKGEYGRYFNGENNVTFRNRFTVLELEELKGRKHLQQVVLLLLIWQVQSAMYLGDRSRQKLVLIDEAWSLLGEGAGIDTFFETGFRRARKYNGCMTIVTQSILDLSDKGVGRAVLANTANTFLLRQKTQVIEELKNGKKLDLTDGGYEWLKTVHTVSGDYSEVLIISDLGTGIGRVILDPFTLLLNSSHPNDVAAIEKYSNMGLDIVDAIKGVLRDREPRHDAA
ncbi:MAG: type IV secretion system protein TraC [Alphaproteobacteria bacterium]|nr:type IV secretion system protein TraC [Alphaproteobacteria bacterium]